MAVSCTGAIQLPSYLCKASMKRNMSEGMISPYFNQYCPAFAVVEEREHIQPTLFSLLLGVFFVLFFIISFVLKQLFLWVDKLLKIPFCLRSDLLISQLCSGSRKQACSCHSAALYWPLNWQGCILMPKQYDYQQQLKILFKLSVGCQAVQNIYTFCVYVTYNVEIWQQIHFSKNTDADKNLNEIGKLP